MIQELEFQADKSSYMKQANKFHMTTQGRVRTENLGSVLLNYIKQRTYNSPKNTIIVIVGEPGSGKSNAGVKILEKLNPMLFERNTPIEALKKRVSFTPEGFSECVDNGTKKGDVIIYDEPQISYNSRDFMSNTNKLLNKILTTYRHRQLITIFCTPSLSYIDAQARKLVTLFVEMKDMQQKKGYAMAKVYKFKYNGLMDEYMPNKIRFVDNADGCLKEISDVYFGRLSPEIEEAYKTISFEFKRGVVKDVNKKLRNEVQEMKERPVLNLIEKEVIKLKYNKKMNVDGIAEELGLPRSKIRKAYRDLKKRGINFTNKSMQSLLS